MGFYDREQYDIEHHTTLIFPASTADVCTLNSHINDDTWSDYTEIVDAPGANSLSTLLATEAGHIAAMVCEDSSVVDKIFMVEISYGASHIVITRFRLQTETNQLSTAQSPRVRSHEIPVGETLYYRCMCETGGNSIEVHFRIFLHITA